MIALHKLINRIWLTSFALCFLFALLSVARVVAAKVAVSKTNEQVVVVSTRPQIEDAAFKLQAQKSKNLLYVRAEESFAKSISAQFGAERDITFYLAKNHSVSRRLGTEEGYGRVEAMLRLERDSSVFPNLAAGTCVGLGLGLVLPLGLNAVAPVLILAALLSFLKYATACPTCPRVEYAGIDAALIGAAVFSVTAGLLLGARKGQVVLRRNLPVMLIVASVLLWQTLAWWDTKLQCLPCGIIALVLAYILGSGDKWTRDDSRVSYSLPSMAGSGLAFASVAGIVIPGTSLLQAKTQVGALTALGAPRRRAYRNVTEIGLASSGKRRVVYIAAQGCHACELGLEVIDGFKVKGVDFLHVGSITPDKTRKWKPVPHGEAVHETPLTLFVEADGSISRQVGGFNGDTDAIRSYCNDIQKFLSDPR